MEISHKRILEKMTNEEIGFFMVVANDTVAKTDWKFSMDKNKELHTKLVALELYEFKSIKGTHVSGAVTPLGKMVYYSITNFFNQ